MYCQISAFHAGESTIPTSDVTFSVFKMMFSPAREHVFFKICIPRTYFPILVIVVSSKWISRLSGSTISMFECGHMVLMMIFSPAREHYCYYYYYYCFYCYYNYYHYYYYYKVMIITIIIQMTITTKHNNTNNNDNNNNNNNINKELRPVVTYAFLLYFSFLKSFFFKSYFNIGESFLTGLQFWNWFHFCVFGDFWSSENKNLLWSHEIYMFQHFRFHRHLPCLFAFVKFGILQFYNFNFYVIYFWEDFDISQLEMIMAPELHIQVLDSCHCGIFRWWAMLRLLSRTHYEGNLENNKFVLFMFARRKSWKTQWCTNVVKYAQCLWNQCFYEMLFHGVRKFLF